MAAPLKGQQNDIQEQEIQVNLIFNAILTMHDNEEFEQYVSDNIAYINTYGTAQDTISNDFNVRLRCCFLSDLNGMAPIHLAALLKDAQKVDILLRYGADINAKTTSQKISAEPDDIINAPTQQEGAPPPPPLPRGGVLVIPGQSTALHIASKHYYNHRNPNSYVLDELLAKEEVDPNLKDADGNTALHIAVKSISTLQTRDYFVTKLLNAGADKEIRNNLGNNVLEVTPDWYQSTKVLLRQRTPNHAQIMAFN